MVRIEGNLYIVFFKGISQTRFCWFEFIMKLCKLMLLPGARMEHVAPLIVRDTGRYAMYHTCKTSNSKWKTAHKYLQKYPPSAIIHMGPVSFNPDDLTNEIKPIRFEFWSIIFWYLITRWFIRWKPKRNCSMQTIKVLRWFGYDIKDHVAPITLYKELKSNAYNYDCWESGSWKDYSCKDHSSRSL